jgi:hypothetical protein
MGNLMTRGFVPLQPPYLAQQYLEARAKVAEATELDGVAR